MRNNLQKDSKKGGSTTATHYCLLLFLLVVFGEMEDQPHVSLDQEQFGLLALCEEVLYLLS